MAIQTRNSALAIKPETSEGVPVSPSASTDYVALQDDASMEPAFDVLENAELKASLGRAKPILGLENPTFSFSHYLRHSGVEGQAPNYKEFLEAAFGTETVNSTERDTEAGWTVSGGDVGAAEGTDFPRGTSVMVKNAADGYEIRPVHSVSTDTLTLGFDLENAPASGVNLGKAVTYSPADTDHQTLSIWHYLGSSGAIQMMAGSRVVDSSFSIAAGELINASYSLEGIKYYFNPIEIDATNDDMDFDDGGGEENVSVAQKMYTDPHELADALQTAMDAATSDNITVTYSDSTGKFTIASDGGTLSLLWNTGTNTATTIGSALSFTVSADDTGSTSYTGDNVIDLSTPQTPSFDSADPLAAKDNQVLLGDSDDTACFAASSCDITLGTPKRDILSVCSSSGKSGSIINAREVTVSVSALLEQYDVDKFKRFRENTETRFAYIGGTKSGGNWEAGKCFCWYLPTCTITSFNITDDDGLVTLELELQSFVDDSGNGEAYLSFV